MTSFGRRRGFTKIYLNVYDLAPSNEFFHPIGLGFYHTGVEILGSEYTFAADAGVFHHTPREVPDAKFRIQLELGNFEGDSKDVSSAIRVLGDDKFGPNDYNIIQNNCNHFSNALCWKLLQKPIPAYINRVADIGACCSCLIPKKLLEGGAPVTSGNEGSSTSSFLARAPPGRTLNSGTSSSSASTSTAFSGSGSKLGGSSSTATTDLTDRREKARMAALKRLEQQKNDSDKSL